MIDMSGNSKYSEKENKKNMITLFRWILLKQKKIKWELALWQFIDKQANELLKNQEEIETKFVSALAEIIHNEEKKDS